MAVSQPACSGISAHLGLPLFAQGVLDVDRGAPVISPEGKMVVFPLIETSGARRLWLRPLDSMSATPLGGTTDGYLPFWSPDESQIGFFANGMLKVFRRVTEPCGRYVKRRWGAAEVGPQWRHSVLASHQQCPHLPRRRRRRYPRSGHDAPCGDPS